MSINVHENDGENTEDMAQFVQSFTERSGVDEQSTGTADDDLKYPFPWDWSIRDICAVVIVQWKTYSNARSNSLLAYCHILMNPASADKSPYSILGRSSQFRSARLANLVFRFEPPNSDYDMAVRVLFWRSISAEFSLDKHKIPGPYRNDSYELIKRFTDRLSWSQMKNIWFDTKRQNGFSFRDRLIAVARYALIMGDDKAEKLYENVAYFCLIEHPDLMKCVRAIKNIDMARLVHQAISRRQS
jgi:hypothetical protein